MYHHNRTAPDGRPTIIPFAPPWLESPLPSVSHKKPLFVTSLSVYLYRKAAVQGSAPAARTISAKCLISCATAGCPMVDLWGMRRGAGKGGRCAPALFPKGEGRAPCGGCHFLKGKGRALSGEIPSIHCLLHAAKAHEHGGKLAAQGAVLRGEVTWSSR